jgi:hypothetical protein
MGLHQRQKWQSENQTADLHPHKTNLPDINNKCRRVVPD